MIYGLAGKDLPRSASQTLVGWLIKVRPTGYSKVYNFPTWYITLEFFSFFFSSGGPISGIFLLFITWISSHCETSVFFYFLLLSWKIATTRKERVKETPCHLVSVCQLFIVFVNFGWPVCSCLVSELAEMTSSDDTNGKWEVVFTRPAGN